MTLDPDPLHIEPDPDPAAPSEVYLTDIALVALLAAIVACAVVALIVWRP